MSVQQWSIKPGELRGLPGPVLALFAGRAALRVAAFVPATVRAQWRAQLNWLIAAAGTGVGLDQAPSRRQTLSNLGAQHSQRRDGTAEEVQGRCMLYALLTLAIAVDVVAAPDLTAAKRLAIAAARHAASIPAVLAHAGQLRAPDGVDPVTHGCVTLWTALRGDLAGARQWSPATLRDAPDPLAALRNVQPLWPADPPDWLPPDS